MTTLPVRYSRHSESGFSLIELLVSFTLIAIISGIGFASFVTYSRTQIVTQTSSNIKQTIELAKFNAISSVKPDTSICEEDSALSSYKINICDNVTCLNSDAGDYEIVVLCGTEQVVDSYVLPDGILLDDSTTCGSVTFNVINGIVSGVPCQIVINGFDNEGTIEIDQLGNVSN